MTIAYKGEEISQLDGILKVGTTAGGFCEDASGFEQVDNLMGAFVEIFGTGKD